MLNWVILIVYYFCMSLSVHAKVLMNIENALKMYFPKCQVEEEVIYLKDLEVEKVQKDTQFTLESKLLTRKIATCEKDYSYIYFDSSVIRTKPQTLMVIIKNDELVAVELLSYEEPENYIPGKMWYETFKNKKSDTINETPHVSGATLTHRATTQAIKKIFSLHKAVKPYEKK
jgi:uncharacterized protein with FMN-binding domain